MVSPQYYTQLEGKMRYFRKTGGYTRSEDGLSPSQSSDYEDQDDYNNCSQQIATVHMVSVFATCMADTIDNLSFIFQEICI